MIISKIDSIDKDKLKMICVQNWESNRDDDPDYP